MRPYTSNWCLEHDPGPAAWFQILTQLLHVSVTWDPNHLTFLDIR